MNDPTQVSDKPANSLVGVAARGGRHPKPRMRWISQWNAWFWMSHGGGRVDQNLLDECCECGALTPMGRGRNRCRQCSRARYTRRRKIACLAHAKVFKAVRRGILPPVRTLKCADCGALLNITIIVPTRGPLEVDAVCNRCNKRRGPAIEIRALIEKGL